MCARKLGNFQSLTLWLVSERVISKKLFLYFIDFSISTIVIIVLLFLFYVFFSYLV